MVQFYKYILSQNDNLANYWQKASTEVDGPALCKLPRLQTEIILVYKCKRVSSKSATFQLRNSYTLCTHIPSLIFLQRIGFPSSECMNVRIPMMPWKAGVAGSIVRRLWSRYSLLRHRGDLSSKRAPQTPSHFRLNTITISIYSLHF